MIIGIGTDIIEVERIKKIITNYSDSAIKKIFTDIERDYCEQFGDNKYEHYAVRYAAKEAFSKAIGTGFTGTYKLNEVGVVNMENGRPELVLYSSTLKRYEKYRIHLSVSHIKDYAVSFVIIEE